MKNKGEYFQIALENCIEVEVKIKKFRGKEVDMRTAKVLCKHIGPDGMRFFSHLRFPENEDLLLEIKLELMDELKMYEAEISWRKDEECYQYEVHFVDTSEKEKEERIKKEIPLYHQLQLANKNKNLRKLCHVVLEDEEHYFKKMLAKN